MLESRRFSHRPSGMRVGTFWFVPLLLLWVSANPLAVAFLARQQVASNHPRCNPLQASDMDFQDMNLLKDLVVASSLSYLSSESMDESSPMEASPYFSKRLQPLLQVVEPKTESGATLFRYTPDSCDPMLVVACRGSATPVNFSTNLRFRLVPLQDPSNDFLVHEGFQEASQGLWKLLAPRIQEHGAEYSKLIVTGHSLGAANALLCAVHHQKSPHPNKLSLQGVVTFGGPRLVNRALADDWNSRLLAPPIVVRNYVHDKDPILRQNGPLWDSLGFGIVGTEIPCEALEPKAYHSTNEQELYRSKPLPVAWNILDHCNYLGIFVGPRLL